MLENLLKKICQETDSDFTEKIKDTHYLFNFTNEVQIDIKKIGSNIFFYSPIYECPKEKKEELFSTLMRANLLGNGTGKCAIGLSKNDKLLTLVLSLPYEDNYELFKEELEDFLNYLTSWKEKIEGFLNV